jgi:hypothetical protein
MKTNIEKIISNDRFEKTLKPNEIDSVREDTKMRIEKL